MRILNQAWLRAFRVRIILGKPSSIDAELQRVHRELIASGYYVDFRQKLSDFYLRSRAEIDSESLPSSFGRLTTGEIKLAAVQKTALMTLHKNSFKRAVCYQRLSGKKIWFPISKTWQKDLSELNLKFNRDICHVLYLGVSGAYFLKSWYRLIIDLRNNSRYRKLNLSSRRQQIYFSGLEFINFPQPDNSSFNLCSWLSRFLDEPADIYHACATKKAPISTGDTRFIFGGSPISRPTRFKSFSDWLTIIWFIVRGSRLFSLDLGQRFTVAIELLQVSYLNVKAEKTDFSRILFQSTCLVAKPLWAVQAEKLGTDVVLFHYAIASEPTFGSNPIIQDGIWQLNTWNTAWVVDEQQIAEISLSTAYPPTKYRKVGVPFWGGSGNLKGITELIPIVSVFDTYISANNKFSVGKLDELGWNNRELELEFIRIILEAAEGFKLIIAHKKKRAANDRFTSVREAETSALLKQYPNSYLVVNESVSSDFLISKSSMVISKPVSTTAVAAKLMSIKSVFLDPTCRIHHQDLSLRNLEIVNSVEDLRAIFAVHFLRV